MHHFLTAFCLALLSASRTGEATAGHAPQALKTSSHAGIVKSVGDFKFAWCPVGTFRCGTPDDLLEKVPGLPSEWFGDSWPAHEVELSSGFWMATTEVTREQWYAIMNTRPWATSIDPEDMSLPATNISWHDAEKFMQILGSKYSLTFRFPTEAEWEYACRAGTQTFFFFGNSHASLNEYAWNWANTVKAGHNGPMPVGKLRPNAWGLYDMSGNVWEWCGDGYGDYTAAPVKDPKQIPENSLYSIRGGSFEDIAALHMVFYRSGLPASKNLPSVGLRLVCDQLTPPT